MTRHVCSAVYLAVALSLLIKECQAQCRRYRPERLMANYMTNGVIFSPGYPDNYPNDADCAWHVTADHGYVIHLRVDWISLEPSIACLYDNITFYDGQSFFHPTLATVCSSQDIRDFYSTGNNMYIRFRSDYSTNFDGFHLLYSAVYRRNVPTTLTWFTARPDTTTSSTGLEFRSAHINTSALIGGITGGLLLLFVICAFCRYYYNHNYVSRHAPRPYHPSRAPLAATAPPASTSTIYQNTNAVFMVSTGANATGSSAHSGYGGNTNYAFSPYGEAPPAYFVAVGGAGGRSGMGAESFPAPPSYTEAMLLSHPPAVAPSYASVVAAQDFNTDGTNGPPPPPFRPAPAPPPCAAGPPTSTLRGQAPPPIGPNPNPSCPDSVSSPLGPLPPLPGVAPSQ